MEGLRDYIFTHWWWICKLFVMIPRLILAKEFYSWNESSTSPRPLTLRFSFADLITVTFHGLKLITRFSFAERKNIYVPSAYFKNSLCKSLEDSIYFSEVSPSSGTYLTSFVRSLLSQPNGLMSCKAKGTWPQRGPWIEISCFISQTAPPVRVRTRLLQQFPRIHRECGFH